MSDAGPVGSLDLAHAAPRPGATWRTHPEGAFPPHLVLAVALLAVAVGGVLAEALSAGTPARLAGAAAALLAAVGLLVQRHHMRARRRSAWTGFERDFRAYVARLEAPAR